jgi:hypothetical protein
VLRRRSAVRGARFRGEPVKSSTSWSFIETLDVACERKDSDSGGRGLPPR